jgi:hypothetical protein
MEKTESSQWPTCSILGFGTFGTRGPAERRFRARAGLASLAIIVLWPLSIYLWKTHVSPALLWGIVGALAPGLAFAYLSWETRRYWLSLDELARRLQLEAAAWTYLIAIAAGMMLAGVSFVLFDHPSIWFWCNPMWVILLEPVRSMILYFLTRRY